MGPGPVSRAAQPPPQGLEPSKRHNRSSRRTHHASTWLRALGITTVALGEQRFFDQLTHDRRRGHAELCRGAIEVVEVNTAENDPLASPAGSGPMLFGVHTGRNPGSERRSCQLIPENPGYRSVALSSPALRGPTARP